MVAIFLQNEEFGLLSVPEEGDVRCAALAEGAQWVGRSRRASWEAGVSSRSGVPHHENQNKSAAL